MGFSSKTILIMQIIFMFIEFLDMTSYEQTHFIDYKTFLTNFLSNDTVITSIMYNAKYPFHSVTVIKM